MNGKLVLRFKDTHKDGTVRSPRAKAIAENFRSGAASHLNTVEEASLLHKKCLL